MQELESYDVVVVGSGMAGVGAALGAAKTGARVLLVTAEGVIGGDGITGMPFLGVCNARGEQVVGGALAELFDYCDKRGGYIGPVCDWRLVCGVCVDPNLLYLAIADAFERYKIKVLMHTVVRSVQCENGRMQSVTMTGRNGRDFTVNTPFIVDATGDATIADLAGFPVESGNGNGVFQPVSLIFRVAGVNIDSLMTFVRDNPDEIILAENPAIELDRRRCADRLYEQGIPYFALSAHGRLLGKAIEEGRMFLTTAFYITPTSMHRNEVAVNVTRIADIDPGNPVELSDSYVALCKQVEMAFEFLKSNVPGFEVSDIAVIAHRIGIRETRRIVGDTILDAEDVKAGRKQPDGIAKGAHHIDIHGKGKDQVRIPVDDGKSYDIPFGCLIPQGSKNVLNAGRCISSTREGNSTIRLMGNCTATGEAAGTAAALCVKNGLDDIHSLDIDELRDVLKQHNAILDGTN